MRVRVQPDGLRSAQVVENAQTVVIYDDFDQPILAVQRTEKGQILSVKAGDSDFKKTLDALGIGLNARVVIRTENGDQRDES